MQRVPEKGWEGMRGGMRMGGNKDNSNTQIEGAKQININDNTSNRRDKDAGKSHHSRNCKQGIQKGLDLSQTTLNDCWKGKEKGLQLWSEEMAELEEVEKEQARVRQESLLLYV